jgi:hypothetical protein
LIGVENNRRPDSFWCHFLGYPPAHGQLAVFRVARSLRIDLDMLVAPALKNSQLTCGERHVISETRHKEYKK